MPSRLYLDLVFLQAGQTREQFDIELPCYLWMQRLEQRSTTISYIFSTLIFLQAELNTVRALPRFKRPYYLRTTSSSANSEKYTTNRPPYLLTIIYPSFLANGQSLAEALKVS